MNQPTPAIVAQSAVRRLPRVALLLLCVAYVMPGFIGREPWKNSDLTAFGYMLEIVHGTASWFKPTLMGIPPEVDGLLPYWLGAWAIKLAPAWIPPDFAIRIPYALLLAVTLSLTWYAVYYLARGQRAQPVAFAFGGEARPADYARTIADGALLALIASLGLAQLSHETTPSLVQLASTALAFYGMAALAWRPVGAALSVLLGLVGLSLSGAPAMGALFAVGALVLAVLERNPEGREDEPAPSRARMVAVIAAALLISAAVALAVNEWRWRLSLPHAAWREWRSMGRLLLWFTWPALPLALWTIWRWRRQLGSRHVALPLWFFAVALGTTIATASTDRSLLLGLPALATLAAFALPTFRRAAASLIDWFTLLFFSGCAIVIWVIWISMQTGIPAKPAANVAKLAPGFTPVFSSVAFVAALAATVAWIWLVYWRASKHRPALWKSLVLPAGGATLSWLLITTLWMPLLDYARSYAPLVQAITPSMGHPECVETFGLSRAQIAAFQFHGKLKLKAASTVASCPWMLVDDDDKEELLRTIDMKQWTFQSIVRRPTDAHENVLVYRRAAP